ncbi:hypothetical protein ACWEJ6_43315 [Nonomuraea sp. NPDC004702]
MTGRTLNRLHQARIASYLEGFPQPARDLPELLARADIGQRLPNVADRVQPGEFARPHLACGRDGDLMISDLPQN